MKVIVTHPAFYGGARRRPGTVMTLPDETKGTWFKVVPEDNSADGKSANEAAAGARRRPAATGGTAKSNAPTAAATAATAAAASAASATGGTGKPSTSPGDTGNDASSLV